MFKTKKKEVPHEEIATLSALVFRFLGEKMECHKLLKNGTLEVVLYLLKAGGLELPTYTFHLGPKNTQPVSEEIKEITLLFSYLSDDARKATDKMARRIILEPRVSEMINNVRRLTNPPQAVVLGKVESWWLPLITLMRESAEQALHTGALCGIKEKEETLSLIAQESVYRRVEQGMYGPYQRDVIIHRTEAWKKARALLTGI